MGVWPPLRSSRNGDEGGSSESGAIPIDVLGEQEGAELFEPTRGSSSTGEDLLALVDLGAEDAG